MKPTESTARRYKRMTKACSVYLIHDDEGRLKYVGAACDPAKRIKGHLSAGRKWGGRIGWWLRGCERAGRRWTLKVHSRHADRYKAEVVESKLIRASSGIRGLLNINQGRFHSARIRQKAWSSIYMRHVAV